MGGRFVLCLRGGNISSIVKIEGNQATLLRGTNKPSDRLVVLLYKPLVH